VFGLLRMTHDGREAVVCLHNVTQETQSLRLNLRDHLRESPATLRDLLSEREAAVGEDGTLAIDLPPHATVWLAPQ